MASPRKTVLCQYRYDPLDRLTSHALPELPERQRFYCKSRLATEIQGAMRYSIVQQGDQLLAQQRSEGEAPDTTLLATDQQRSVLKVLKGEHPPLPIAYSPYGHRPVESGLLSLLGFNGERPDPMTGCYLLGNGYRAFNPVLMRFNSPDGLSPFDRGGMNSYAYCMGDPVNIDDPDGHGWFRRFFSRTPSRRASSRGASSADKGVSEALSWNKYNAANYNKDKGNKISGIPPLKQSSMDQVEKQLGALSGRELEKIFEGPNANAIKAWDNKTGVNNMHFHWERDLSPEARYAVMSEGIAGNLNGVLPYRAKEFSMAIMRGDYPQTNYLPSLTEVRFENVAFKTFNLDRYRQIEIYRDAGVKLPNFLMERFVEIPATMQKIRTKR